MKGRRLADHRLSLSTLAPSLSLLHGARRPETEMQFGAATCIKCISVHSRALGPIKNAPVPRAARVVSEFRFAKNALQ